MNDQQRAAMQYCRSKHGLNYACWVAYRPIEEIEDLDEYIRVQTRATFVFEDQAKWFCKQFNDAIAQKVEPCQLGNECVEFDSPLASTDRAAMQMALKALEKKAGHWGTGHDELNAKAITALREALRNASERMAQPKKPDECANGCPERTICDYCTAQPQGEPVAWHEPNAYGNVTTHKKWAEENGWLPLYTKE